MSRDARAGRPALGGCFGGGRAALAGLRLVGRFFVRRPSFRRPSLGIRLRGLWHFARDVGGQRIDVAGRSPPPPSSRGLGSPKIIRNWSEGIMPVLSPVVTSGTNFIFDLFSLVTAPGNGNQSSCKPLSDRVSGIESVVAGHRLLGADEHEFAAASKSAPAWDTGFQSCQMTRGGTKDMGPKRTGMVFADDLHAQQAPEAEMSALGRRAGPSSGCRIFHGRAGDARQEHRERDLRKSPSAGRLDRL